MIKATQRLGAWLTPRLRRPVSDGTYRPEIDGLRFLAIAVVIVGHLLERDLRVYGTGERGLVRWGMETLAKPGAGVFLFFSVSGFVIATQFLKRPANPLSGKFLSTYFKRRVLRIEPPYILLLLATFALITLTGYSPSDSPRFAAEPRSLLMSLAASLFYVHMIIFNSLPRLFPPGWSLEMEVQFYLLAPAFFYCLSLLRNSRVRTFFSISVIVIGIGIACFIPWSCHAPYVQRSILLYLPYFWVGVAFADWQNVLRTYLSQKRWLGNLAGLLGLLAFSATNLLFVAKDSISGAYYMSGLVVGTALMFVGVLTEGSMLKRFCSVSIVSMIGGQCYSIYLTHLQVLQIIAPMIKHVVHHQPSLLPLSLIVLVQIAVILIVGIGFYIIVERPFMVHNWPSRVADRVRRLFARSHNLAVRQTP